MSLEETVWDDAAEKETGVCVVCSKEVVPYEECHFTSTVCRPWLPVCVMTCEKKIVSCMSTDKHKMLSYEMIRLWMNKKGQKPKTVAAFETQSETKQSSDELREAIFQQIFG